MESEIPDEWGADMTERSTMVFCSSNAQYGGQESTLLCFHTILFHPGMGIVGLPYAFQGQTMNEITGGSLCAARLSPAGQQSYAKRK
jgi:NAD(P)H dehydrogenase (quinone)